MSSHTENVDSTLSVFHKFITNGKSKEKLSHRVKSCSLMSEYGYKKTPYKTGSNRADNGTRTRGLNLGKVALYQLSYVRKNPRRISWVM